MKIVNLSEYSNEKLHDLIISAKEELESRKEGYTFEFYSEGDKRNMPYIAKVYAFGNKIKRSFYQTERIYSGRRDVIVHGKYTCKEGDVIEERDCGRYYFLIQDGERIQLCDNSKGRNLYNLLQFLKEEIDKETLFERLGIKEINTEIIDELKDEAV